MLYPSTVGSELQQVPDDLGGMRGRQQADAAAHQAGGESDREAIAVRARIEEMPARRHLRGQNFSLGEKRHRAHGSTAAIGDDRVGRGVGQ
jgi:hypothetical protein